MKNELECAGCMYRQVPEHFVPCLGCKNNRTHTTEDKRSAKKGAGKDEDK